MRKTPRIITSLLLLAGFGISLQGCGSSASFLTGSRPDPRTSDRKFEQVPAIAAAADGKIIYVAWYSGGAAPGPGNFITVSASTDRGNSWLNDQLIVLPKKSTMRFFDPALWRDKNGRVHLFYGSSADSLLWDGKGGVNTLEMKWDGSRINHDQPKRISDGVMSNKPVYVASRDIALMPVYIDKPANDSKSTAYPPNGAFILSHDYSRSGRLMSLAPYSSINIPDEIRIHDEPQLVEISDKGDFLAMVRTTKGIYFTRSSDFGKTWSEVAPFTASGPTTSSRFYIGKLSSGNLLLISNNSKTRNNMTAFLSMDGGQTWPHKLLLDARENVSYPDADQTSDGNIHVVFDRDRTGAKDILYCRFTEDAIVKGNTGEVFKTRVNR